MRAAALPEYLEVDFCSTAVGDDLEHYVIESARSQTASRNKHKRFVGLESEFFFRLALRHTGLENGFTHGVARHYYPVGGEEALHAGICDAYRLGLGGKQFVCDACIGILLLQQGGYSGALGCFQGRAACITAYADCDVGLESTYDTACEPQAFPQLQEHPDIGPQMLAVESGHRKTDDFIACVGYAFHLHAVFRADKEYFCAGHLSFYGIGD